PAERGALGEPVALQAVASLDELGTEITQRSNRPPALLESDALAAGSGNAQANGVRNRPSAPPPLLTSPLSSLAPREVSSAKVAAAVRTRDERGSGLGALAVAAVMLLATGAWWLTSGTFQRTYGAQTPAAQPPAPALAKDAHPHALVLPQKAAVGEELAVKDEGMAKPSPVAPTPATPAPTESEPAVAAAPEPKPTHAKPARVAKPSVAATRRDANAHAPRVKPALAPAPTLVPTEQPSLPSDLPEAPTRGEVIERLESVRSSVRACAGERSGVAELDITIAHTGNVTHVLVGGDFAGTTEGSCIARAVRGARFASFKQERFRLLFPFAI
ncbi:MAG: hypothetical protein RL701_4081, partial [Pseudomonadota bacterium]